MDLTGRKAELAGRGLFTVQLLKNLDRNGQCIILKLSETLGVVQEDVGIKNKDLCLGGRRFFLWQGSVGKLRNTIWQLQLVRYDVYL